MTDLSKIELILKSILPAEFFIGLADGSPDKNALFKEELDYLKSVTSPERQKSYILGRIATKRALNKMGLNAPVGREKNGEPIWPTDIIGSLSNKGDLAVAAVSKAALLKGVGLDLESLLKDLRIIDKITKPSEKRWVLENDSQLRLTKIFSAKEALFKAIYPTKKTFFGFQDAELTPTESGFSCQKIIFSDIPAEQIKIESVEFDKLIISSVTWR